MSGNKKESGADQNRWYSNPSFGLGLWGPLVPANDCKTCMATVVGAQFFGGALLWWLPGRRPPLTRTKWQNRGIRALGFAAGSYLMFFAAIEGFRLMLPYDPWVEDARMARIKAQQSTQPPGLLANWFGPRGYKAVPFEEWRERLENRTDRMDVQKLATHKQQIENLNEGLIKLRTFNRNHFKNTLSQLRSGTFVADEQPHDVLVVDDDVEIDTIEFHEVDLWDRMFHLAPLSLVLIVHTPPQKHLEENEKIELLQRVEYTPVPVLIQKV